MSEIGARLTGAEAEVAWSALLELAARPVDPGEKKAGESLASAWETELLGSEDEDRRLLLVHALGALRTHAKSADKDLARLMAGDRSAPVRLACTLALVRHGDSGLRAGLERFDDDDLVGAALACAIFGAVGQTDVKKLAATAGEANEFRWFLLSEPALVALELAGEIPPKFLAIRADKRKLLRAPKSDELNWFGLLPFKPSSIASFQKACLRTEVFEAEAFELPTEMRCAKNEGRACDYYADALGHVARAGRALGDVITTEKSPTLVQYRQNTLGWTRTLELLLEMEEKLLPRAK